MCHWGSGATVGLRWPFGAACSVFGRHREPREWLFKLTRGKVSYIPIVGIVEPGFGLLVGLVVALFDSTTGLFICFSAIMATLKCMAEFVRYRDALLDRADAEFAAKGEQEHATSKLGSSGGDVNTGQSSVSVVS